MDNSRLFRYTIIIACLCTHFVYPTSIEKSKNFTKQMKNSHSAKYLNKKSNYESNGPYYKFIDHKITKRVGIITDVRKCVRRTLKRFYQALDDGIIKDMHYKQQIIAEGSYGVVVSSRVGEPSVRKIAKDFDESIKPDEFPWEYCISLTTQCPYVVSVIPESFAPYEVSKYPYFITQYMTPEYAIARYRTIESNLWHIHKFVPSFKMEECTPLDWNKLKNDITIKPEKILRDLIYAVNYIHQSYGLNILDVSKPNLMMCDKNQIKFIDMAFSRFTWDINPHTILYGTKAYRSPWASTFAVYFHEKLIFMNHDDHPWEQDSPWPMELFYLENEAYDFWAIGALFMEEMCLLNFTDTLKDFRKNLKKAIQRDEVILDDIAFFWEEQIIHAFEVLPWMETCNENTIKLLSKILVLDPQERLENVSEILNL